MPRKKSAATPTSAKGQKRQLPDSTSAITTSSTSTRTSKRIKLDDTPTNKVATTTKSKYFEGSDSEDDEDEDEGTIVGEESGYEDEDASVTEASEPPTESDDFDSEEETRKRKRGRKPQASKKQQSNSVVDKDDLWKEGVKTGLGPGKQVFIAKPKPRSDGGIKYIPEKIHPNTMAFLTDLKKNNDREWLKMHDPDFRQSWKDWESFVESLTERIAEIDETIPELPPKDLVFRIYRDVRFSKDPTPYKTHFSAAWSRTGRKGPYAAYYVQIQPGGRSFVGSGLWCPDAQPLRLLRRSIDRRPERLRAVLVDAGIRKHLLGGISKDEKKAIKAFADQNAENALKSKPKVGTRPLSFFELSSSLFFRASRSTIRILRCCDCGTLR